MRVLVPKFAKVTDQSGLILSVCGLWKALLSPKNRYVIYTGFVPLACFQHRRVSRQISHLLTAGLVVITKLFLQHVCRNYFHIRKFALLTASGVLCRRHRFHWEQEVGMAPSPTRSHSP